MRILPPRARTIARRRRAQLSARRHWRPDQFASFGQGSWIEPPVTITCSHRIHVGDDVRILPRAWLSVVENHGAIRYDPVLRIGNRSRLGRDLFVACMGSVEIGSDVLVSDRVFIGDTFHDYRDPFTPIIEQRMSDPRPVRVGDGAFLGVGSCVLPGVDVGSNAYVGAGAVVTDDVPERSVVVGNPARVIRHWDGSRATWRSEPG